MQLAKNSLSCHHYQWANVFVHKIYDMDGHKTGALHER